MKEKKICGDTNTDNFGLNVFTDIVFVGDTDLNPLLSVALKETI